jgi:ferredoxin-NADP reductase
MSVMPKTQIYHGEVTAIHRLTPRVKSFQLKLDRAMEFAAGQFVFVHVERGGKLIRKPYSIASPPYEPDRLELAVTQVTGGYVSTWFHDLQGGEKLTVEGPAGRFVVRNLGSADLVCIATGTGVAPFRSMLLDLFRNGFDRHVWLIFGVRHEDEILYEADWRRLTAEHPNFHFVPTISRPKSSLWAGEVGYVQTKIANYVPETEAKDVLVCGVVPMVKDVTQTLLGLGFHPKQIKVEKYT